MFSRIDMTFAPGMGTWDKFRRHRGSCAVLADARILWAVRNRIDRAGLSFHKAAAVAAPCVHSDSLSHRILPRGRIDTALCGRALDKCDSRTSEAGHIRECRYALLQSPR